MNNKYLTVKDLRMILDDLPDDLLVLSYNWEFLVYGKLKEARVTTVEWTIYGLVESDPGERAVILK